MPLLGQASGGFTESSSALRLLHVGVRNTVGILTDDAFTQTNPPLVTGAGTISTNVDTSVLGVLSGSVAFTRPDQGSNYIGGPVSGLTTANPNVRPLGLFINNAAGYAYENQPAAASGKGPYVSAMGTYASQLFETQNLNSSADLTYTTGQFLYASQNGYLTNVAADNNRYEQAADGVTTIAILKMPADSVQNEIVFDQRI
ncbi:MAG: hypothetical protein EBT79_12225 [Actinobacteria bacterium]|nr:hypothetical protein [Actinomycetota bacterium]NBR68012.1 hypothetical protein [Actinomycetota bacterium]